MTLTAVSGKISLLVLAVGFRKAEASTFISCGVSLRGGKKRVGLFAWKGCVTPTAAAPSRVPPPSWPVGQESSSSLGLHVFYEPGCHYCPPAS